MGGVFSGTVSYVLNELAAPSSSSSSSSSSDGGGGSSKPRLSEVLREAVRDGLCEPDPRDDLRGMDVRRKVVVLARELGLSLEMEDVPCESLLPAELEAWTPDTSEGAASVAEQLCDALAPFDDALYARVMGAGDGTAGNVPVQLAMVDAETGTASISFTSVPGSNRMARVQARQIPLIDSLDRFPR